MTAGMIKFWLMTLIFFTLMIYVSYSVVGHYIRGTVTMAPNLNGLPINEALDKLKDSRIGLLLEDEQPHQFIPQGHILSQFPTADTSIKNGASIRVVISSGAPLISIPDLRGQTRIAAGISLRRIGLNLGHITVVPMKDTEGGQVLATDPPEGTGVVEGRNVNLLVSTGSGKSLTRMPNLFGWTEAEAEELFSEYDLVISEVTTSPNNRVRAGEIHRQSPPPGVRINHGSKLEITLAPEGNDNDKQDNYPYFDID
jgi:beta-lactam-binding protein with PASTA domain